jgi:hypothetical protein
MPQRRTLSLTAPQRQELLHHRDHDARPYVRERCAALLKIADGQAPHAVAVRFLLRGRHPDTVYAWLDHYGADGLAGVLAHQQGGDHRSWP